jgi:hypothetical protein
VQRTGVTDAAPHILPGCSVGNVFNRMNVIVQQPAGDYRPGQFG